MDYISRETAKHDIVAWARVITQPDLLSREDALTALDCIPAADVRPVVRAHWEYDGVEGTAENPQIRNYCSACEMVVKDAETQGFLLCPFCGAKMGGQDNA